MSSEDLSLSKAYIHESKRVRANRKSASQSDSVV